LTFGSQAFNLSEGLFDLLKLSGQIARQLERYAYLKCFKHNGLWSTLMRMMYSKATLMHDLTGAPRSFVRDRPVARHPVANLFAKLAALSLLGVVAVIFAAIGMCALGINPG
jgi:hypothetical protein